MLSFVITKERSYICNVVIIYDNLCFINYNLTDMMKKLFVLMSFIALGMGTAFAQKGEKSVGINFGYGTEINNLGIGAKFQYGITDAIRTEASFDYFLKKDFVSMWDINLNVHYLFPITDKFKIYPLVGLTYTNWKLDGFDISYGFDDKEQSEWDEVSVGGSKTGKFGVNLGAGIEYPILDKLNINFEVKYQLISDFNQAVFAVGAAYKF